jgi:taurine dioxygenase
MNLVHVTNVDASVGAVIEGLSLDEGGSLDEESFRLIVQTLVDRGVVVLRGLEVPSDDDLVGFVSQFQTLPGTGNLEIYHDPSLLYASRPEILYVTNAKTDDGKAKGIGGSSEMSWHCNLSYKPSTSVIVTLSSVEIPRDGGGDTHYIDLSAAYDRLPSDLKTRIEDLQVHRGIPSSYPSNDGDQIFVPEVVRSLVRTSPLTGGKSIFDVGAVTLFDIIGLTKDESRQLMADLFEQTTAVSDYVHKWQVGDIVMWDNVRMLHRRDAFDQDQLRLMRLVEVLESEPSGFDPRGEKAGAASLAS